MLKKIYYILVFSLCLNNVYAHEYTNKASSSHAYSNFFSELGQELKNPSTRHLIKQALAASVYTCAGILAGHLAYQNSQALKKTDDLLNQELLASNILFLTAASGFCVYKSYTGYTRAFTTDALMHSTTYASLDRNGNVMTTASFAIEL